MIITRQSENVLIKRTLFDNTGVALPLSSLTLGKADIIQNGVILQTYTYTSAQLHIGGSSNEIVLDIPTTLSAAFSTLYPVEVTWTLKVNNSNFAEGFQEDIISETILQIV